MALWRDGGFAENEWTCVADDAPAPADEPVVVSLKRWLAEGDTLASRERPRSASRSRPARTRRRILPTSPTGRWSRSPSPNSRDGRAFSYAHPAARPLRLQGRTARGRRRADRRDPVHAALRLHFVRGEQPPDTERPSGRSAARSADPLPAGQRRWRKAGRVAALAPGLGDQGGIGVSKGMAHATPRPTVRKVAAPVSMADAAARIRRCECGKF